jgi:hypothetical protein
MNFTDAGHNLNRDEDSKYLPTKCNWKPGTFADERAHKHDLPIMDYWLDYCGHV